MKIVSVTDLVKHHSDLKFEYILEEKALFINKINPVNQEEELLLTLSYPLTYDDSYIKTWKKCSAFMLEKEELLEKEIKKIEHSSRQIGWLIPIEALNSAEHQYGKEENNPATGKNNDTSNFIKFALIANQILASYFAMKNGGNRNPSNLTTLGNLCKANSAVLLLNTERLPHNFDIYSLIPCLALNGFFFSSIE